MVVMYIILLAILCGIFGRMGGAGKPYRSWVRDWICPMITLAALWLLVGFNPSYWWVYLMSYGLMGLSLTSYYDAVFGYDNLWVAGYIAGISFFPLICTGIHLYALIPRAILLSAIWGLLNKYRRPLLCWRGDVVEEFLRYASLVATLPVLTI